MAYRSGVDDLARIPRRDDLALGHRLGTSSDSAASLKAFTDPATSIAFPSVLSINWAMATSSRCSIG